MTATCTPVTDGIGETLSIKCRVIMRITVLVMNAGSKLMTTTPVTSDDGGIGETLGSKMLLYMRIKF